MDQPRFGHDAESEKALHAFGLRDRRVVFIFGSVTID